MAAECGLADIMAHKHVHTDTPSTYIRGKSRLDFILISADLIPAVKRCGYEAYNASFPSDHRGMYIDFDSEELFKCKPISLPQPDKRDFTTQKRSTVIEFITEKHRQCISHNVLRRIEQLHEAAIFQPEVLEAIDRDVVRASLTAAKKCKTPPRPPWSPKIARAWAKVMFFKLIKSSHKNHIDNSDAMHKYREQSGQPLEHPPTLEQTEAALRLAKKELRKTRQCASEIRQQFLQNQVNDAIPNGEGDRVTILKRIQKAEEIKAMYRKIRRVRGTDHQRITQLQVPADPRADPKTWQGEWVILDSPDDIQARILQHNKKHFSQAHGTPMTTPTIQEKIGYIAHPQAANEILAGTFQIDAPTPASELFLAQLKAQVAGEQFSEISIETFRRRLRRWKESTTTSPSGVHWGHYRAMVVPVHDEDTEKKQEELLRIHLGILNLAIRHGYPLKRWKRVLNVMIPKDGGIPKVHRLRVIHIYEADYNLLLGSLWKNTMHKAEKAMSLNEGLYGGRKGRCALDPVQLELLQYDIYTHSMKSGITMDLDAASCYDRILASMASIASQSQGLSPNAARLNSITLRDTQFRIKTSLGISTESYSHTDENPIHGTGQGSGNSPMIWNFISSALFNAFQQEAFGSIFESHNKTIQVQRFMTGFVDDCSMGVNLFTSNEQPTNEVLAQRMSHDAQLWCDLLWASGGKLELSKCMIYFLRTSFSAFIQTPHLSLDLNTPPIEMTDPQNGQMMQIPTFPVYKSHRTLGVHVNPAGKQEVQFQRLQEKADNHARIVATNSFNTKEIWTYYSSVYLPSMTYPLSLTNLSRAQCNSIESSATRVMQVRMGYSRHISLAIRYGPARFGGLGIHRLHQEQAQSKLIQFVSRLRSNNTSSKMTLIALSWVQAYAGVGFSILQDTLTNIPYLPQGYISSVRDALYQTKTTMVLENSMIPPLLRQGDQFLMDIAIASRQFDDKQLASLNRSRLFLQVLTVADISDVTGTKLLREYTTKKPPERPKCVKNHAFNQCQPTPRLWYQWKRLLKIISLPNRLLRVPLRQWKVGPSQQRREWKAYYSPLSNEVYANINSERVTFTQRVPGLFQRSSITPELPPDAHPVQAKYSNGDIRIFGTQRALLPDLNPVPELGGYTTQWTDQEIHAFLRDGNIIAASDGSVLHGAGAFGWAIKKDTTTIAEGNGPAPDSNPSSFHAEACGLMSLLQWIHRRSSSAVPTRTITVILDNQALIRRMKDHQAGNISQPNDTLLVSWAITQFTNSLLEQLIGTITFHWVKSHQDSTSSTTLSREALLNVQADKLASQYQRTITSKPTVSSILPGEVVQLRNPSGTISHHYKGVLRLGYSEDEIKKYYEHRFQWDPGVADTVDWAVVHRLSQTNYGNKRFFVRHLFAILPTAKYAHRNNPARSPQCPFCPAIKDNNHFLFCPINRRWRRQMIDAVDTTLSKYSKNIPFPVRELLRDGIRHACSNSIVNTADHPASVHSIIHEQTRVGWTELLRGKFVRQWSDPNQWTGPITSTQPWVHTIAQVIFAAVHSAWVHRNEVLHGDTPNQIKTKEHLKAEEDIRQLYTLRNKVLPREYSLFQPTADTHIASASTIALRNWVTTFRPLLRASAKKAASIANTQRPITQWLQKSQVLPPESL